MQTEPALPLQGRHILVVEDEYMTAFDLRAELVRSGAVVEGPVPTVSAAMHLIASGAVLDGAVLDVRLRDETCYLVADALRARGIPFVFYTGLDDPDLPTRYENVVRCDKPTPSHQIVEALRRTRAL